MKFDWTINLGNIIPIISFILLLMHRITQLETKVDILWEFFQNDMERRANK